MPDADAFIESFLAHAGSQYYDAAKAHEYYERTKELKGRQSTTNLKSQGQKEGWSYAKAKVGEAKKADLDTTAEANKGQLAQLRSNSAQRREAIATKIAALMDKITGDVQGAIDSLPQGLSKEQRAKRVAQIRKDSSNARSSGRAAGGAEREKVAADLKSGIDDAREAYKKARDQIKAKYDETLQTEYDAIRTNVR